MEIYFDASKCKIQSLEHVQVIISAKHSMRGALRAALESPSGKYIHVYFFSTIRNES